MPVADRLTFTTSLLLYRPTRPPILTTCALADFITALAPLGLLQNAGLMSLSLKSGPRIDMDTRRLWPIPCPWPVLPEGQAEAAPAPLDVQASATSLQELIASLRAYPATLYRAQVNLGEISPTLQAHLHEAAPSPDAHPLALTHFSIDVGPIEALRLSSDDHFLVGWLGLNFSGSGHIAPWHLRPFLARAAHHPGLESLLELCRRTWPVPTGHAHLPRPRYPLPWDWQWAVHESAMPA